MAAEGKGGAVWAIGAVCDGAVSAASVLSDGARVFALGGAVRPVAVAGADGPALEAAYAEVLQGFLECDLIGLHDGAAPVADGAVLAMLCARPVVWDFASADRQMGGFGAPLAPFFHFALARWMAATGPIVFLETGAVTRLSWVDPAAVAPEAPGACLAFDVGPGIGGAVTGDGVPDEAVLARMLGQGHFARMPPKRLKPDEFSWIAGAVARLDAADRAATLAACVAVSVADAMAHLPRPPARLLVSGAGRNDPGLMTMIAGSVDCPVAPVEAAGLENGALAAQAIGHLAVRVMRGLPTTCPGTTGGAAAVGGGQIARPD